MRNTSIIGTSVIFLMVGIVTDLSAQKPEPTPSPGPPKLVIASPRPTGTPKPAPPRVIARRNPPKNLLEQKWPAPADGLAISNAIQTAEGDVRIKSERALSLLRERKPELALPLLLELATIAPDKFEVHYYLGISLGMLRKSDEAVSAFQKATKLNPRSAEAHMGLCQVLADTSKRIEAIDECREAVRLAPTRLAFKHELARLYLITDQIAAAIEIIGASQDDLVSMGLLGDGYFLNGEYLLAASVYEKIAVRWPSVSLTQLRLSQVYDYLDRPNDSITAARRFVELEPRLIYAHLNLGQQLQSTGYFEESIEAVNRAVALDPNSGHAASILGETYLILGDKENALKHLLIAYRQLPRTSALAYSLGDALLEIESPSEAIEPLEFANRIQPNDPDIMRALATAYIKVRRYDDGVVLFERANQLSPLPPNIKMDFSYLKNRDQLIAKFDEYLELARNNPSYVNVRLNLAQIYMFKGVPAEAEKLYLEVAGLAPNDYRNWAELAGFYSETGQKEKEINAVRKAIAINPNYVYYLWLSRELARLGRLDEAIDAGRRAVELKEDSLEARIELGELLGKRGRREESMREFQAAFQIAPGDRRPNFRLAWLYIRMGNREGAFRHYGILRGIAPNELKWLELSLRAHFGTLPS